MKWDTFVDIKTIITGYPLKEGTLFYHVEKAHPQNHTG
jgi:hypothetical protein